ncbi:MAG: DMT family transporter [Burkholderiaceae bacterium]|nr:DMT family transporter [Burkholderiaceae bacterium]
MQSLWMLFASFVFAFMGVCVKLASQYYSTSELVMYRGLIGVIFLAVLVRMRGGTLKTTLPWPHLKRGVIGVTSLWMWFFALGALPLASAMTLNYTSSIWMAAMLLVAGWWQGTKRTEWGLIAAIVTSFVGVALLLHPSFNSNQWFSGLVALCSGIVSAIAYLQVRDLGRLGEPEYRVVFYFSATGAVTGLLTGFYHDGSFGMPALHAHTLRGFTLLATIGVTAAIAQMAMTRAYHLGKTLVTANLQYTGIVFSSIWGMIIWSDMLGWQSWTGIALILASGMAATYYNVQTTRAAVEANIEADPIVAEISEIA